MLYNLIISDIICSNEQVYKNRRSPKILGVTVQTLRRWERKGELAPDRKSEGGTRYYDIDRLLGLQDIETDLTIGYARTSSHDQKNDLSRQAERLKLYCAAKGWNF